MITFENVSADQWYRVLAATVLLTGLWWSLRRLEFRRIARLHGFAAAPMLARLITGYSPTLRRPLNVLLFLAVLFALIALAGPQWGEGEAIPGRSGREVLVLLDTSESMNAANPAPDRLDRARRKITELLLRHPADRFGLVAFSGAAALQCPLTSDHAYFKTVLQSIDTNSLSEEGTDIESALNEAASLFLGDDQAENTAGREGRIVLLISDGEEVSGTAIEAARALADTSHVMVMGIGDPEGAEVAVPQWMGREEIGAGGPRTHHSVLDEENLSAIAVAGNGVYVRSTLGDEDLQVIDRELAFLAGTIGEDGEAHGQVNRYRWPLALAFFFFALEGLWLVLLPRLARRGDTPSEGSPLYDAA